MNSPTCEAFLRIMLPEPLADMSEHFFETLEESPMARLQFHLDQSLKMMDEDPKAAIPFMSGLMSGFSMAKVSTKPELQAEIFKRYQEVKRRRNHGNNH